MELHFYERDGLIYVSKNFDWAGFTRDGQLARKSESDGFIFVGWTDEELQDAAEKIRHFSRAPYPDDVYLRFNTPPIGGKSRNYATGQLEKGVSCYALRWDLAAGCYMRTGGGLDGAMFAYLIQKAPIYLITGKKCGVGSDGEPLVENVKVLARAKFDHDKGGWSVDPSKND